MGSHELMEGCVWGGVEQVGGRQGQHPLSWKVLGVICTRPPGLGRPHTMGSRILPYPSTYTHAHCAGSLGTQTAGTQGDPVWSGWGLPHETRPVNNPGPVGPFQGGPDPGQPRGRGVPRQAPSMGDVQRLGDEGTGPSRLGGPGPTRVPGQLGVRGLLTRPVAGL